MLRASRPGLSCTEPWGVVSVCSLSLFSSLSLYILTSAGPSGKAMATKTHDAPSLEGLLPVCLHMVPKVSFTSRKYRQESTSFWTAAVSITDWTSRQHWCTSLLPPCSSSFLMSLHTFLLLPNSPTPSLSPPPPPLQTSWWLLHGWSKTSGCLKVGQHQKIVEVLESGWTASEDSRSSELGPQKALITSDCLKLI